MRVGNNEISDIADNDYQLNFCLSVASLVPEASQCVYDFYAPC